MTTYLFLASLATLCAAYLVWGMKILPGEAWQIAAALPFRKDSDGSWRGVNLTWYGILTANAYAVAVSLALVLMGVSGVSLQAMLALVALLLGCCVPASRLVAQLVEGKRNTFTVGGAVFVGIVAAPWLVQLVRRLLLPDGGTGTSTLAPLAAIAIAYAFGEGLGRLACVSFGCCYGKPLSDCSPLVARIASPFALTFAGKTKKISYASGLEGVKVLPVQGITYLLYTVTGLLSTLLYLRGGYGAAFLLALVVTQGWRVLSEFLRDDYRGGGRISAYQVMGMVGIGYGICTVLYFSEAAPVLPELGRGLASLWTPVNLLLVQLLWVGILLYTGLSRVTSATLSFHVNHDKI